MKSAMYGQPKTPPLFGFITGLSGRDITAQHFKDIAGYCLSREKAEEEIVWIGVKR